MPRYVIYGAGAIGGAIGATLFEAGHDVLLIARGAHLQAILDGGLRFETPLRSSTQMIAAVDHPSKISFQGDEVILLCTKSQDTIGALQALDAVAPAGIPVVCVQNGVENERVALRTFSNVYGSMIICPATYLSPGLVEDNSAGKLGIVAIGHYPYGEDDLTRQIAADLAACGWHAESTPVIEQWKYAKLLDNLSNATQVVLGLESRGGEVAELARQEGIAALEKAGQAFLPLDTFRALRAEHMKPGNPSGPPRGASTWQSVARGTGSVETDYLNGEIVLLGRLHGIATPVNELLQRLTNELARQKPGAHAISETEFLAMLGH